MERSKGRDADSEAEETVGAFLDRWFRNLNLCVENSRKN
jgi:hypothetical protein